MRPRTSTRVRLLRRLIFVVVLSFVGGVFAPLVRADTRPEVSVRVSNDHPAMGESFDIEMTVVSDSPIGSVSASGLAAPPQLLVTGPSIASSTRVQISGGVRTTRSRVTLRWHVTPTTVGILVIPGPTATVGGQTVQGKTITIDVARGSGTGSLSLPNDYQEVQDVDDSINRQLALDSAPDPDLFLHAIPDKTVAIVGEQVTVSFYVYFRVDFTMTEHKEASLADFLRIPLLTDPSSTSQQTTTVGGKRFGVRLIDRVAAFPLKAGKLKTGSVSARFTGRRLGANVQKISDEAVIDVSEPPETGRPPGYVMGTVGKFELTATVAPRTVDQRGSVSVNVVLSGIGNIPTNLKMPQQPGVDWLDPQRRDTIVPHDDKVGGARSFGFVATLSKSGDIDLGTLELPYFDPETRNYEIAKVSLGRVAVRPAAMKTVGPESSSSPADDDLLANLPKSRSKLSPYQHPDDQSIPAWGLGAAIAFPPVLVGLGFFVSFVGTGFVRRRREAKGSTATKAREALAAARRAEKKGDVKELAAAIERAVHASIEERTAIKSRAVMRDDLGAELEKKGVSKALATEVGEVLAECELLRFAPSVDEKAMAGLVARATTLTRNLTAS